MADPKTTFLSYSWDNDGHKQWVADLATRLVQNGVLAHLDQWDVQYGESLTEFMDDRLPSADFVVIICTPNYFKKAVSRQGGVGYEAQIISARIAASIPRRKFVPIIRNGAIAPGQVDSALPPHLQGVLTLDMRDDGQFELMFENLLRHIYGTPALTRPALGPPPGFALHPSEVPAEQSVLRRLAYLETEHWHLSSGVLRNEQYPDTFHIPDEALRRKLVAGDIVKLSFEFVFPEGSLQGRESERMWVIITGTSGPYYIGVLDNEPVCADDWHDLAPGSEIVFLPEHVIDIYSDAD